MWQVERLYGEPPWLRKLHTINPQTAASTMIPIWQSYSFDPLTTTRTWGCKHWHHLRKKSPWLYSSMLQETIRRPIEVIVLEWVYIYVIKVKNMSTHPFPYKAQEQRAGSKLGKWSLRSVQLVEKCECTRSLELENERTWINPQEL